MPTAVIVILNPKCLAQAWLGVNSLLVFPGMNWPVMGYKKALQEQASAPNQSSLAEHPPPGRAGTLEVERGKGQGPSATYSQQVRNEPATQTLNPADTLPNFSS